jgi:hypothetical protein
MGTRSSWCNFQCDLRAVSLEVRGWPNPPVVKTHFSLVRINPLSLYWERRKTWGVSGQPAICHGKTIWCFLVWLLLYAHRHRSILGAAGHILTPANQLMEEYSEPPEWTEKIASLCFGQSGDRTPYLLIRSQPLIDCTTGPGSYYLNHQWTSMNVCMLTVSLTVSDRVVCIFVKKNCWKLGLWQD